MALHHRHLHHHLRQLLALLRHELVARGLRSRRFGPAATERDALRHQRQVREPAEEKVVEIELGVKSESSIIYPPFFYQTVHLLSCELISKISALSALFTVEKLVLHLVCFDHRNDKGCMFF